MVKTEMQQKNLVKQGPEWRRYDTVSFDRTDEFKALSAPFEMTAMRPIIVAPISKDEKKVKASEPTGKIVDNGKYVHIIPSKNKKRHSFNMHVPPTSPTHKVVAQPQPKAVEEVQPPPNVARPTSARQQVPVYINLFDSVATDIAARTHDSDERKMLIRLKKKVMYQGRNIRTSSPIQQLPISTEQHTYGLEKPSVESSDVNPQNLSYTQVTLSKVYSTESAAGVMVPGASIFVPSQRRSFDESEFDPSQSRSRSLTNTNEEIISLLHIKDNTVDGLVCSADTLPGGEVVADRKRIVVNTDHDNTDIGSVPQGFSLQSSRTVEAAPLLGLTVNVQEVLAIRASKSPSSPSSRISPSSRPKSRINSRLNSPNISPGGTRPSRPAFGPHIHIPSSSFIPHNHALSPPRSPQSPKVLLTTVQTKVPLGKPLSHRRNDVLRGSLLQPNPTQEDEEGGAGDGDDPLTRSRLVSHFPIPRVHSVPHAPQLGATAMDSARDFFPGKEDQSELNLTAGAIDPSRPKSGIDGKKRRKSKSMKSKKRDADRKDRESFDLSIDPNAMSSRQGTPDLPIRSAHGSRTVHLRQSTANANGDVVAVDLDLGGRSPTPSKPVVGISDDKDDDDASAVSQLSSQDGGEGSAHTGVPLRDLSASYGEESKYSLDVPFHPLNMAPFQVHRRIMGWKLTNPKRHKTLMDLLEIVHLQHSDSDSQGLRNLSKEMRNLMHPPVDDTEAPVINQESIRRQTNAWVSCVERMVKSRSSYQSTRTIREMMSKKMAKKQQYHAVVGAVTPGQTRNAVPCYNSGFMKSLERGGLSVDKRTSASDGGYSHVLAMKAKAKEEAMRNAGPPSASDAFPPKPLSPSHRMLTPLNKQPRDYLSNQLNSVREIEAAANKIFTYPMDINLPRGRTDILDSVHMRLSLEKEMNLHHDKKWVTQHPKLISGALPGQSVAFFNNNEYVPMSGRDRDKDADSLPDTIIPKTGPRDKDRGVYAYNGTVLSTRLTKGPF